MPKLFAILGSFSRFGGRCRPAAGRGRPGSCGGQMRRWPGARRSWRPSLPACALVGGRFVRARAAQGSQAAPGTGQAGGERPAPARAAAQGRPGRAGGGTGGRRPLRGCRLRARLCRRVRAHAIVAKASRRPRHGRRRPRPRRVEKHSVGPQGRKGLEGNAQGDRAGAGARPPRARDKEARAAGVGSPGRSAGQGRGEGNGGESICARRARQAHRSCAEPDRPSRVRVRNRAHRGCPSGTPARS